MARARNHYDNLMVARNASLEVIRAAYKTLSQKYHPDRNPGNDEAARIMVVINAAFDVLSDPDKRASHDRWIAKQELLAAPVEMGSAKERGTQQPVSANRRQSTHRGTVGIVPHLQRNWPRYAVACAIVWIVIANNSSSPPSAPRQYQATAPVPATDWSQYRVVPGLELDTAPRSARKATELPYVRESTAPNGRPWPAMAGYVSGYQRLRTAGLSSVTVDNLQSDSEVFAKLFWLDSPQPYPVRQLYVPAFGSFTLRKVTAGTYDVRYRDLASGKLLRSEAFKLEEVEEYGGTRYSNITMTLYKVKRGNMQSYPLPEAEFE